MAEKIYVDGLRTFPKHEKAPDFVLGTLIVTPEDIVAWLKANPQHGSDYQGKTQIRIQMTRSDKGKVNLAVDTWKPEGGKPAAPMALDDKDPLDLPF